MKELFEQNKVLFLAVITILIAVFLIKKLIEYVQKKGIMQGDGKGFKGIRLYVYELFVESEERFKESGQGQAKFDYVIQLARSLLPKPVQIFVTDNMLKEAVQLWFDGIKDLLDDGKLNASILEEREEERKGE